MGALQILMMMMMMMMYRVISTTTTTTTTTIIITVTKPTIWRITGDHVRTVEYLDIYRRGPTVCSRSINCVVDDIRDAVNGIFAVNDVTAAAGTVTQRPDVSDYVIDQRHATLLATLRHFRQPRSAADRCRRRVCPRRRRGVGDGDLR